MLSVVGRIGIGLLFGANALYATAANLTVYDDQSENGFNDGCSFGGVPGDFNVANTVTVHTGTHSIRFTPDNFNAVSWCAPATYSAATDFTGIDFWVNGGTTGGQNVDVVLGLGVNSVIFASLTSLNGGNPIPAATWVHIQAPFTTGALMYAGQFDKISLQDESGAVQANMYFDDVALVGPSSAATGNYIFGDSFESEYMLVPQYNQATSGSIFVYQRTPNTTSFTFVREAPLGAGTHPNAVSFAPDGGLWVVDDGSSKLLRYSLQSMLGDANPAATAQVGPTGQGSLYDLAFFGANAYVSSDGGILRYSVAAMNAGSNPAPTILADANTPVGLAFDAQGRLWIVEYGTNHLVQMDTPATNNHINITITGAPINAAEGLAFDPFGSLWIGDNNEPTLYAYGSSQINASGSPVPIGQINMPDAGPNGSSGFAGGIAFDRRGDIRVNYEYDKSV
ncbi:MAG: hypothetical protein ABIW82_01270, partial [Dokdonella sp.]